MLLYCDRHHCETFGSVTVLRESNGIFIPGEPFRVVNADIGLRLCGIRRSECIRDEYGGFEIAGGLIYRKNKETVFFAAFKTGLG